LSIQTIVANHFKDFSFIKKIEAIMFQSEFIAFEKNINNEWLFPIWLVIELIKIVFNVEYLIFYSFLDALTKEKKSIELMYLFIGEINVAISTASLKSGDLKICTPSFDASNNVDVSAIYHSLIENCIPNNVDLFNKSMLPTGSNRSGKSTFIRTVAINSLLAQTLHICFLIPIQLLFIRYILQFKFLMTC
jgi:DNA mismatch repair ATPase MutS